MLYKFEIFQAFISVNLNEYGSTNENPIFQKILILHKTFT